MIEKLLKWNKLILILLVAITAISIMSIKKNIYLETNLDKYMPKSHPAFVYSDKVEEIFDIRDAIMIAVENKNGVYNPTTLKKVKKISKALQKLDVVEDKDDVLSLYTADNIKAEGDELVIKEFFKRVPKSEKALKEIQDGVKTNEMVYKRLVSEDETATIIMTKIKDNSFSQELYDEIESLAKEYEGDGDLIYIAGQPIVEGTMASLMPKDMRKMFPVVLLLIVIILASVLRSFKGTLSTMLVVILSAIWTFGLMAGVGIPIYAPSSLIPVMLIAIGVADGIHIYSHLQLQTKKHPDWSKEELIKDMISQMWKPVVMTSVTTAIGFLSLLTSDIIPIRWFALFTAIGVLFAMVLSLVLIPVLTQIIGIPKVKTSKQKKKDFFAKYSKSFADALIRRKSLVWGITALIILFFGYGVSKVWINSSFLARFPDDSELVKTDAFVNSKFMGTTSLNVILESKEKNTFKKPKVLNLMGKVAHNIEHDIDQVGGSLSINDFIKRMNKVLNGDKASFYSIPKEQNLISQYFLLYEMSGGSKRLWELVDEDFQIANLRFQLKSDNSKGLDALLSEIESYKDDFKKLGIDLNFAGSGYKVMVFNDLILTGQIKSILLSFVIIFILLAMMFKSMKIGLISTIPIAITTIISFGVLGLLNIPLETTTALISSIAIGIGIDYAVHFIDRYKINAEKTGDLDETIEKTMAHSGRAISFNAVVVVLGFLVLTLSAFKPNKALGAIVSLNMFTSFIATLTVMFLVMYVTKLYFNKNNK